MAYPLTGWNTGLFDCCADMSSCCYGFWCCPCLACTVAGRFDENRCLPLCDIFSPAITSAIGLPLCVPPAALALRVGIRHRYGIKGSLCKDIVTSCFSSGFAALFVVRHAQDATPDLVIAFHSFTASVARKEHLSQCVNRIIVHPLWLKFFQQQMAAQPLTDWNSGLCDCFEDASTCCYGFWCCPCLACTVSERFGENRCLPLCDICSPAITASFGIPLCAPPAGLSLRAAIRNKYGIKGSLCKDIATSCFCVWCSWCQMQRELKHRKKNNTVVVNMQPAPVMMAPGQPLPVGFMAQPGSAMVYSY